MPLTPEEKVRVRYHLGYAEVNEYTGFVAGGPAGLQSAWQVEGSMNRLLEASLPLVRSKLAACDALDDSRSDEDMVDVALVTKLGDIEISPLSFEHRDRMYQQRVAELARALGVTVNPFDPARGGGLNVSVRHG